MKNKSEPARLNVGQSVEWVSSSVKKTGVIVGIIPRGRIPRDESFNIEGGLPRDHDSYIVDGFKSACRRGDNKARQVKALYWPRVSLLHPVDTLTDDEINWCKSNVTAVRKLMASAGK